MATKTGLINLCNKADKFIELTNQILPDDIIELKEACEKSFYTFVKTFWTYAGTDQPYMDNWHIQAIAEHLQACHTRQIRRLILNIPPGFGKSTLCSILYPSFRWLHNPVARFLYPSYSEKLSIRDNRNFQMLINSDLFQQMWGDKVQLTYQEATSTHNTHRGYRISCGFSGSITGHRVSDIIADDPNSLADVHSETIRGNTNRIWDSPLSSRFSNMQESCWVIVQQRAHSQDLSGYLLDKGIDDIVHLRLPMEFESHNRCKTIILPGTSQRWQDPRKKDGELLFPELFNKKSVERQKISMSGYDWAGQYQQNPSPVGGEILKGEYFEIWKERDPPECDFVLQSWDTALTTSVNSAFSVCTTWGIFQNRNKIPQVILLDMWKGRVEYPELRHMAQRLAKNYHDTVLEDPIGEGPAPDIILIEQKVSGYSLIQDLRRAGVFVTPFNPRRKGKGDSSKETRARIVSAIIEAGRVWLPAKHPNYEKLYRYAQTFLEACEAFPNDDSSKDIVDSMSQALLYLMDNAWVAHPEDDCQIDTSYHIEEEKPLY